MCGKKYGLQKLLKKYRAKDTSISGAEISSMEHDFKKIIQV